MQRVAQIGADGGVVRIDRDGTIEELRRRSFVPAVQGDDTEQVQGVRVLRPVTQNHADPVLGLNRACPRPMPPWPGRWSVETQGA